MTETSKTDSLARAVHVSLLTGSVVSALLFIAGLAIALVGGKPLPDLPPQLETTLFRAAFHFAPVPLLVLGLLVLILTRLIGVVTLAAGWALAQDFGSARGALMVFLLRT